MHLTQVRISIIDTFGVSFVLLSYYFLYRFIIKQRLSWLLISGIFFGLASAIKWSAVFASVGFLFISLYLIISKYPLNRKFAGLKLILYGVLSYIVIGLAVYYLTFYIYMEDNSLSNIIKYQVDMYKYHSALQATHPYSSEWWSWIIDYRPMCYYRNIVGDRFSSITVFGNPAIFWTGIVAILYLLCTIKSKKLEAIFILSAFFGLYLPYIFVGRLMFIYHFYYAVPFLILAIIYMFKSLIDNGKIFYKYLLYLYIVTVIVLFLMYYPVLSGFEVAKWYVDNYLVWFNGWWL
jgi:dolichyl-phosphate-mannose--protein O-mannosyl transferase